MNLDGSDLTRIITPSVVEGRLQAIHGPSWTPDGQSIVFGESLHGHPDRGRIAKCDIHGSNLVYLTGGPVDCQPHVSPDGKEIAYIHWVEEASRLYLMDVDGSNQHPLSNPDDKRWGTHGGNDPAWSPDGKRIYLTSGDSEIIDVDTGRVILDHRPTLQGRRDGTCGWPQWGKCGLVGFCVGGILLTDSELREAKWVGSSKLVECSDKTDICRW